MNAQPDRSNVIPLHRGVFTPRELAQLTCDIDAIYDRFDGAPVHERIGPSRLETVTVWAGLIVASWAVVYFAAQLVRGWL